MWRSRVTGAANKKKEHNSQISIFNNNIYILLIIEENKVNKLLVEARLQEWKHRACVKDKISEMRFPHIAVNETELRWVVLREVYNRQYLEQRNKDTNINIRSAKRKTKYSVFNDLQKRYGAGIFRYLKKKREDLNISKKEEIRFAISKHEDGQSDKDAAA